MFVSLHMDSAPNPLARGASVYSLSDVASDAEAARFAASENAGLHGRRKQRLGRVDPVRSRDARANERFGRPCGAAGQKSAGRFELRPDPHRFAAFHVLRRAGAPAVLFEAGYISNADDELLLRSPEHRSESRSALAQAIEADVAAHARR